MYLSSSRFFSILVSIGVTEQFCYHERKYANPSNQLLLPRFVVL